MISLDLHQGPRLLTRTKDKKERKPGSGDRKGLRVAEPRNRFLRVSSGCTLPPSLSPEPHMSVGYPEPSGSQREGRLFILSSPASEGAADCCVRGRVRNDAWALQTPASMLALNLARYSFEQGPSPRHLTAEAGELLGALRGTHPAAVRLGRKVGQGHHAGPSWERGEHKAGL